MEQKAYAVNFGTKSVDDEFNTGTLGAQWHWLRENLSNWSLTKKTGSMLITSGKGDLADASNNAENVLLQSANSDWTMDSKFVCSRKPLGMSQYAGILAYQDDDNFVRLVYKTGMGRRGFGRPTEMAEQPGAVELMIESDGGQKSITSFTLQGDVATQNTVVLRLVKKGELYTAYCSSDGRKYQLVGTATVVLKDIQAGLMVCDGVAPARMGGFPRGGMPQSNQPETPFEVAFDSFKITNRGLK